MLVVTCPNKQQKLEWHMGIEYGKAEVIFITGPKQAQQCQNIVIQIKHGLGLSQNHFSRKLWFSGYNSETDCTEALYLQIQAYQHNQKNIIGIQLVVTA